HDRPPLRLGPGGVRTGREGGAALSARGASLAAREPLRPPLPDGARLGRAPRRRAAGVLRPRDRAAARARAAPRPADRPARTRALGVRAVHRRLRRQPLPLPVSLLRAGP